MGEMIGKRVIVLIMATAVLSCTAFAGARNSSVPEKAETQKQAAAPGQSELKSDKGLADEELKSDEDSADEELKSDKGRADEELKSDGDSAGQGQKLLEDVKKILPIILGMPGNDPAGNREWLLAQIRKLVRNPEQYSEDFWDSLFGTGADGISKEGDTEEKGRIVFAMDLPEPVKMPDTYSVTYCRLDDEKSEVMTTLERDSEGNIHYLDGENECVFIRTDEGFRMYPVLADRGGFGEWDGTLRSARSVRSLTEHFWNCADQTFIKWLGAELKDEAEYLGRQCGLYHAQPGTLTFTYQCDMVIDEETGICLCYTADELLKGPVYNITEDDTIEISIGDYDIGGDEMKFYCTDFRTEGISFEIPEE